MNVQVELDCQVLVKALQGSEMDLAAEGLLFREIRQFARLNFSRAVFSFAPRACNKLAHALPTFGACHQTSLRIFRMMYPSACPALWLDLCEVWNRCVPFQKKKKKKCRNEPTKGMVLLVIFSKYLTGRLQWKSKIHQPGKKIRSTEPEHTLDKKDFHRS